MRIVSIGAGLLLASTSTVALAQTSEPAAAPPMDQGQLEDIVVTAQRREERLQDVPIAITAITADSMARSGVTSFSDLSARVPGLTLTKATFVSVPTLRGVGNPSTNPGNDPSIATYVDGVYQPNGAGLLFSFNNIERVEVLKGPQGTLFGRNATGGLIQVITGDPSQDFRARGMIGYGNFDTLEGSAYVSGGDGPISANLGLVYSKQRDGWGTNRFTLAQAGTVLLNGAPATLPLPREEAGIDESFGLRGKVLLEPTDTTQIRLWGIYTYNAGDQGLYRHGYKGSILSANGTTPYVWQGSFYDQNTDFDFYAKTQVTEFAGQIDQDLGFATLKSITAHYKVDIVSYTGQDITPMVGGNGQQLPSQEQFTQELQLLSPAGSSIQWVVGAYYLNSDSEYTSIQKQGNLKDTSKRTGLQHNRSLSGFGQATINLFENTRLTGGIRYTTDKISASNIIIGQDLTTIPAPPAANRFGVVTATIPNESTKQSKLTWKASIDQKLTPDILAYASVSTGFKAGAYNVASLCLVANTTPDCVTAAPAVAPETLTDYEVGIKSDLLDRKLRLNLSGFYYDYKNLQVQVNTVVGGLPFVFLVNAAAAKVYGGELESTFIASRNLQLNGGLAWTHARYTDFPNAVSQQARIVAPYKNATVIIPNAKGNRLNRTPEITFYAGFDYTLPETIIPEKAGSVTLSANLNYSGKTYWDPANLPETTQDSYSLLNASLTWAGHGNFGASLWGKNLTGKKYCALITASGDGTACAPAAPRTYGIRLTFKWD
jgi:iron complex outermembrane receptor protein